MFDFVVDIAGNAQQLDHIGSSKPTRLPEDLTAPTVLVTDYAGATCSVETLPAKNRNIGPVVEKMLRDRGDLDSLSKIIIHSAEQQGDIVRVFFTAVPLDDYMRYRQWAEQSDDHLVVFPVAEAMLSAAKRLQLNDGMLLFVHDRTVHLVMFTDGRVVEARRARRFGDDAAEIERLARFVFKHWKGRSDSVVPRSIIIESTVGEADALRAAMDTLGVPELASPLPSHTLFEGLSFVRSEASMLNRAAQVCTMLMPVLAIGVIGLCLVVGAMALSWKGQVEQIRLGSVSLASDAQNQLVAELQTALAEAHALQASQGDLMEFARLAQHAARAPDPATLVHDLRAAVPDDIQITEAGLVSDEEGTLIVIAGRSELEIAPFDSEERFVRTLASLGYQVVQRDIEGTGVSSTFRLGLIKGEP